jgi:hypothetical protein
VLPFDLTQCKVPGPKQTFLLQKENIKLKIKC